MNVHLLPEWRDDGHITFEQTFQEDGMNKLDWSVSINDGKKEGLTFVDVSIQMIRNENDHKAASDGIHAQEEVTLEKIGTDGKHKVPTLVAKIPEKCNVKCALFQGGDIVVTKKLEGEDGFEFLTSGGDIVVDKLRGDVIQLDSKFESGESTIGGTIHIRKACDAQELGIVVNKGGRLRAKMLNVSNANIETEDIGIDCDSIDDDDGMALIDVSSIYTSLTGEGAHLLVNKSSDLSEMSRNSDSIKKVRVKSNHGHISVRTASSFLPEESPPVIDEYGQKMAHVELGGVNGSFDVSVEKLGGENISNDEPLVNDSLPMAAKIHVDSLSPGQASIITSDFGSVGISLDRKIESDIRLLSTPLMNNMDTNVLLNEDENEIIEVISDHDDDIEELIAPLGDDNDNEPEKIYRISMETEAFSGHRSSDMKYSEYVHGVIDNKSHEPNSRFDVKTKGLSSSVGKIRIEDAAGQALQGFSGSKKEDNDGNDTNGSAIDLPLLAVATNGRIKVESLSWFGAIARRYGVEDEQRDLGRQAKAGSARGGNNNN